MEKILGKLAEKIELHAPLQSKCAFFSDQRYKAIPFSDTYFHHIPKATQGRLAFVDGGNLELFHSPDNSISLVRIYSALFNHNKREMLPMKQKIEFYVHAYTQRRGEEIIYVADIYPQQEQHAIFLPRADDLVFSINEATLSTGGFQVDIGKIGETARRFAEWTLAAALVPHLQPGDVIVHDGTLQSNVKNETKYIEHISAAAARKGIIVSSCAKTTTLLTDQGLSVPVFLSQKASEKGMKSWYYTPLVSIESQDHRAHMAIAKLHAQAQHAFRLEIFQDQKGALEKVIALLAENAKDPAFPGYPYGLVDADKHAGISLKEKQYYSLRLSNTLSEKAARTLKQGATATNAHDIIDRIV